MRQIEVEIDQPDCDICDKPMVYHKKYGWLCPDCDWGDRQSEPR